MRLEGEHDFLVVLSRWRVIVCLECKASGTKSMLRKGFDQARKAYDMLSEYLEFPESGGEWRYYRCFCMGDSKAGEGQLEERLCPRCRPFFLCNGRLLMGALEEIRYLKMYTCQQYLQIVHTLLHTAGNRERYQKQSKHCHHSLSPMFQDWPSCFTWSSGRRCACSSGQN